jgi:hypothetical protein
MTCTPLAVIAGSSALETGDSAIRPRGPPLEEVVDESNRLARLVSLLSMTRLDASHRCRRVPAEASSVLLGRLRRDWGRSVVMIFSRSPGHPLDGVLVSSAVNVLKRAEIQPVRSR